MTSHLARLAVRAAKPTGSLRPRSPSMFESSPASLAVEEYAATGPATPGPNARPAFAANVPARPVTGPAEPDPPDLLAPVGEARPVVTGAARVACGLDVAEAAAAEETTVDPKPAAQRPIPASRTAPALLGVPAAQASEDPAQPARRESSVEGARPELVATRSPTEPASAKRAEPASYSPEATTRNGDAAAPGRPPPAPPYADPHTFGRAPVRLPRLQPPTSPAERRDVTVNIGRIEVVPPSGADRPPTQERRPARTPASSGAPKLADYLRERSRR